MKNLLRSLAVLTCALAFFPNFLVSKSSEKDGANWMANYAGIIKNIPLNELYIPGSHDSATYELELKMGKGQDVTEQLNKLKLLGGAGFVVNEVVRSWSKAQSLSIFDQLKAGVRFVDLRVVYRDSKKEFYTVHGLYGPSLKKVLDDIKKFMKDHPKELVIIQVGDMRYMPEGEKSHEKLINQLVGALKDRLVTQDEIANAHTANLKQIWNLKKQVILIYNKADYIKDNPLLWPKKTILESYWANANETKLLKEKLDTRMSRREINNGKVSNGEKFHVVQSQMTARAEDIAKSLVPFTSDPKSLKDFAKKVWKKFPSWLDEWKTKNPNIIMLDFVDKKSCEMIYSLNEEMYDELN